MSEEPQPPVLEEMMEVVSQVGLAVWSIITDFIACELRYSSFIDYSYGSHSFVEH